MLRSAWKQSVINDDKCISQSTPSVFWVEQLPQALRCTLVRNGIKPWDLQVGMTSSGVQSFGSLQSIIYNLKRTIPNSSFQLFVAALWKVYPGNRFQMISNDFIIMLKYRKPMDIISNLGVVQQQTKPLLTRDLANDILTFNHVYIDLFNSIYIYIYM